MAYWNLRKYSKSRVQFYFTNPTLSASVIGLMTRQGFPAARTRGGWEYLIDSDGNKTGLYGETINPTLSDALAVYRGGWWYLYTRDGRKMGNIYSYFSGGYYRIATPNGESISGSYSDERPTLTNAGTFRVLRGSNYYFIDTDGNRVY